MVELERISLVRWVLAMDYVSSDPIVAAIVKT